MNNIVNFILSMIKSNNNPQQLVNQMIQQNPQMQILMNQMQQSGMNMKDFTMQYAKQNNIDIQSIIQQLNQFGIKL